MLINDIIMFQVHGTNGGEYWENDHFYRVTDISSFPDGTPFSSVAQAFYAAWTLAWSDYLGPVIKSACLVNGCKARNLFQGTEVGAYISDAPIGGDEIASEAVLTEQTLVFVQPSGRVGMNAGRKSMAGLTEEAVINFGQLAGTFLPGYTQWADWMSSARNLFDTSPAWDIDLLPVIVQRIDEPEVVEVTKHHYRLPENNAEAVTYPATSWAVKPYTSTQNTRKRGRGI